MEVCRILTAWFERRGYLVPSGEAPAKVIADQLRQKGASSRELQDFLDGEYAERTLNDPPVTWKHVVVAVQRWLATYGRARPAWSSDREYERVREEAIRGGQYARRSR
jgi:cytochrome c-type biogenesis protein CcmH/NrfF